MSDFKLTAEQKNILAKKLSHLSKASCQSCGGKEWIASENIFEMREFHGGNLVIGGQSAILPVIPVTCKKCGQTIFFNALTLGILNQGKENEQK
ncbi:MAG: hypothetical protein UV55_C0054G0004 [Candidatus Gottesmanbacteria bacterium GW2011_GWC1_43_10]|nr:MAG: hypothetical protein UV04_C0042G0005 [Candidatus Gottesmanbacteria bacterium GW2011_GWA2_42_16]KKS51572.1 MAG: hypothetical protein UV17_C0060G0014 [Candidatus Gottesmanbacteria bacterium GW2011_GWA1_42_26]KKS79967.1 MAG: hypothetical protein UV55_C0054G0004 [Candidatus Gottesmanbacteria bacterium GW2011_GWC1_43_10]OGG27179.1 MAG: hypothetical protein A3A59_01310 [Candidatus Gottesmanbacteria bacterium RIFCSPLOWO2_01_FULL_42_10]